MESTEQDTLYVGKNDVVAVFSSLFSWEKNFKIQPYFYSGILLMLKAGIQIQQFKVLLFSSAKSKLQC